MSVRFDARVIPRAAADGIQGTRDGALLVRVTPPPVDEAANRALIRLLADALGVAPTRVRVAAGARDRRKTIEVGGVDGAAVTERWPGLTVRSGLA